MITILKANHYTSIFYISKNFYSYRLKEGINIHEIKFSLFWIIIENSLSIRISRFWIVIAEYLFAVLKKNHCSVAQIVDAICLSRRRLLKENKQNESHKIQNNSEITEPPLPLNINNWLCSALWHNYNDTWTLLFIQKFLT